MERLLVPTTDAQRALYRNNYSSLDYKVENVGFLQKHIQLQILLLHNHFAEIIYI